MQELGRMKTCDRRFMNWLQTSSRNINGFFGNIKDNKLRQIISTYQNLFHFQDMAQWRFIDNVAIQVTERHLLGPSGILGCFSVDWVRSLTEDEMEDLVGEDAGRKQLRSELSIQVRELERILKEMQALRSK